MVVAPGRRTALGAAIVVAAVGLAWSGWGRGCADADGSPTGAARAFVAAARAEDRAGIWELLGPETRSRVTEAAAAATDKVGGARRYRPLDLLDVTAPDSAYAPTDIVAREEHGNEAIVDVLGPDGRHDALRLVRLDGRWRVELDFQN